MEIVPEQIAAFGEYVRFMSCDPEQNWQRFYLLCWQPSLQGDLSLECT